MIDKIYKRKTIFERIVYYVAKCSISLSMLVASSNSYAAQWVPVAATSTGIIIYADSTSVYRANPISNAWFKHDATNDKSSSFKSRIEWVMFQCSTRTSAVYSFADYAANGSVIDSGEFKNYLQNFTTIIPDSVGEYMQKYVCNIK